MKTKLLFFLLLFAAISFKSQAQTYYHLVDTVRIWTSTMCGYNGPTPSCITNYYKMDMDTLIGGFTYKGVWRSTDSGLVNPNWSLQGFMREDSSKKVYYISYLDTHPSLYYDFGVTVGDTAHLEYSAMMPVDFLVDSMSTIMIMNQVRNVYYLAPINSFYFYYQTWIEGIGSLNELLIMQIPQVDYSSDLLCFHEHDTLKYFNPLYSDCYYEVTGMNELAADRQITLSPNPTDGNFTINFPAHSFTGEGIAIVTDISGKTVAQQQITTGEKAEMDLSELPAGLYFVRVTGKGISPMTGKVAVY